jgi:hypothetical protein
MLRDEAHGHSKRRVGARERTAMDQHVNRLVYDLYGWMPQDIETVDGPVHSPLVNRERHDTQCTGGSSCDEHAAAHG